MKRHPSGRPIRRLVVKRLSLIRALERDWQPLTPGLRPKPDLAEPIGFYPLNRGDDDDE